MIVHYWTIIMKSGSWFMGICFEILFEVINPEKVLMSLGF